MSHVDARVASLAAEQALGRRVDRTRLLSAGRTSQAWVTDVGPEQWVVRVPIDGSDRSSNFESERLIGQRLSALHCPVARWFVVTVDGTQCSVGELLSGAPVDDDASWPSSFAEELARTLDHLHRLPTTGFGPLDDTARELRGRSADSTGGIVDRWCHATIWPFDRSSLADHPISGLAPDLARQFAPRRAEILAAARGPHGLNHSDLHRAHLLVSDDWQLGGLLDFGDAFIGCISWDFALLAWYYGAENARLVADHYPGGDELIERSGGLAVAVGLYKLAKNPADPTVIERLQRLP